MKNNFSILFWGFLGIVGYIVLGIILPLVMAIRITAQCFDIGEAIHLPEKTIYEYISYQIKLNN